MKLIIFTPAIKTSAIGRMACIVTRALISQGHEVTVVRTETERLLETPSHDFGAVMVPWSDANNVMRFANEADALVYQIGDNYDFHQGGVEWLAKLPGLVCLHDFFLADLFYVWAQTHPHEADNELRNWYGDVVADSFFNYSSNEAFIAGTHDASPLTEWICSMAYSVVTHSSWGVERVLNSCPGPVCVVSLAYDTPATPTDTCLDKISENNQFRLLTIGHINPNKRVASVIRAIGNSPLLRQRTVYRLVGYIQPETVLELSALARKCQVNLLISGEVDDATLGEAVQQADVVSCLRWPSLEAASASAIEAMLYGKPIVVTDTGFYAEIPNTCALKISHDCEISDLQAALEKLATDQNHREEVGTRAKQWASKQFSADNYAIQLIECVTDMRRAEPSIKAISYYSTLMQRWSGAIDMLPAQDMASLKLFESSAASSR